MSKMITGLLILWLCTMIAVDDHSSNRDVQTPVAILEAVLGTALILWGAFEQTLSRRPPRDDPRRGFPVLMAKEER